MRRSWGLRGPRKYASIAPLLGADRPWVWVASMGMVGFFTFMPGTLASGLTVLLHIVLLHRLPIGIQWGLWMAVTLIGVYSSAICERRLQTDDPSFIVIDEWSGQWLALLGLPLAWPWMMAAFVLFRFLDIVKPFGIDRLERFPHGIGVMLDDVVAGAVTFGVLHLMVRFAG